MARRRRLRGRARSGGARVPTQLSLALFRRVFSQIFPTEVVQVLNSKVVDQLTLYNFYKGRIGF
jgi:hypothetical protein